MEGSFSCQLEQRASESNQELCWRNRLCGVLFQPEQIQIRQMKLEWFTKTQFHKK